MHPVRRTLKAAAAACAVLALPGCVQVHECFTRADLPAHSDPAVAQDLAPGTYPGEIALSDPSNLAVGLRFTGTSCHTRIGHDAHRGAFAETSYLDARVALTTRMGESPFYLGTLPDGSVLVVQAHAGGVTSTHTVFDDAGVLVYGVCGSDRLTFMRECLALP